MRTHVLSTALASSLVAAALSPAAVTDGLVGYFPLNETDPGSSAVDNAAPGTPADGTRTGTPSGRAPTVGQTGVVGSAYGFNGSGGTAGAATEGEYVALGSSIGDQIVTSDKITLAAWVNPTFLRDGSGGESGAGLRSLAIAGSADVQLGVVGTNGSVYFNYKTVAGGSTNPSVSSATSNLAGGASVPLNAWTHIAATRDYNGTTNTSTARLYINGMLVREVVATIGSLPTDNLTFTPYDHDANAATPAVRDLYIGTTFVGGGTTTRDFDGGIDDAAIWSGRAVSTAEIALIAGLGRYAEAGANSSTIDAVLGVYNAQSGDATAGDYDFAYTAAPLAAADGSTLYLGKHYVGTDGNAYILLGGSAGAFTGVVGTLVPEPTAAAAGLALAAGALARRRSRRAV